MGDDHVLDEEQEDAFLAYCARIGANHERMGVPQQVLLRQTFKAGWRRAGDVSLDDKIEELHRMARLLDLDFRFVAVLCQHG